LVQQAGDGWIDEHTLNEMTKRSVNS